MKYSRHSDAEYRNKRTTAKPRVLASKLLDPKTVSEGRGGINPKRSHFNVMCTWDMLETNTLGIEYGQAKWLILR